MLTSGVLTALRVRKKKEVVIIREYFDVNYSLNLRRNVRVDLKYEEHIVSPSVNTSCHGTRRKNPFYLLFELRISLSLHHVLCFVTGVFCETTSKLWDRQGNKTVFDKILSVCSNAVFSSHT